MRRPIIVYRVQFQDGGGWPDVEHEVRQFVRDHAGEGARAVRETFTLATSEDITEEVLATTVADLSPEAASRSGG